MPVTATGPSQGKTRQTQVRRLPFYVPFDNDGRGGWRYLPVGESHQQQIEERDHEGQVLASYPLYDAKGYVPVTRVPEGDPRRDSLPVNWREIINAKTPVDPVYRTAQPTVPDVPPAPSMTRPPVEPDPEPEVAVAEPKPQAAKFVTCTCGKVCASLAGFRAHQRGKATHKPDEVHEEA